MTNNIFQLKGIIDMVKRNRVTNVYHRFYNAMAGNTRQMTVELISEIEEIITSESKKMLNHLKQMKKEVAERDSEKQAA